MALQSETIDHYFRNDILMTPVSLSKIRIIRQSEHYLAMPTQFTMGEKKLKELTCMAYLVCHHDGGELFESVYRKATNRDCNMTFDRSHHKL